VRLLSRRPDDWLNVALEPRYSQAFMLWASGACTRMLKALSSSSSEGGPGRLTRAAGSRDSRRFEEWLPIIIWPAFKQPERFRHPWH
jgi:hypothetical protein